MIDSVSADKEELAEMDKIIIGTLEKGRDAELADLKSSLILSEDLLSEISA